MRTIAWPRVLWLGLALVSSSAGPAWTQPANPAGAAMASATPAPPGTVAELRRAVEHARARFEARDAVGVLAWVSEQYRSAGLTKAAIREQLLAMFALYQELRARVTVDRVDEVGGATWIYTSGEIAGRLPLMGWVTVLAWQAEPEVARREAAGWRLVGFQD